jgi:hypothetical protein
MKVSRNIHQDDKAKRVRITYIDFMHSEIGRLIKYSTVGPMSHIFGEVWCHQLHSAVI